MYYIVYKSVKELINDNAMEKNNILMNKKINILRLSNYIDSLLISIPSKDIIINIDNKDIIRGGEFLECVYLFIEKNIRLSDNKNINKSWRNKTFYELNERLRIKLLANTIRVIYVSDKYSKYY